MIQNLKRMRLMSRLAVMGVVAFICMVIMTIESVSTTYELVYEDRQVKTKHVVETASAVLEGFYNQQKAGTLSEEEAKAKAIAAVKTLRYEKTEYFWINDLGKPFPKMIMHPTVPALDGKVLDDKKFDKAVLSQSGMEEKKTKLNNTNLFVAFVDVVEKSNHGFVEYMWPKPKAGGGTTEALYPKLSYVKKFEPWGWVIGSGIYIDDVEVVFKEHMIHSLSIAVGSLIIMLLVGWFVRKSIFDEFGGEPKDAIGVASKIASGDLTVSVDNHVKGSLMETLDNMKTSLHDLVYRISEDASSTYLKSNQLVSAAEEIEKSAAYQSDATSSSAASVEELTVSINHISDNASTVLNTMEYTVQQTKSGVERAASIETDIGGISNEVEKINSLLQELNVKADNIGAIVSTIKDIADQTNLLALNAAIEAARAGDQGRGFAVVADEVRKLAEKTSASTKEISTTIKEIQNQTQDVAKTMGDTNLKMKESVSHVKETSQTIYAVEYSIKDARTKVEEIVAAIKEQSAAATEIARSIEGIARMSDENAASTQSIVEIARDLTNQSSELSDSVKVFNIVG